MLANDYITLMRQFTPLADYLAINVSSPNTAGLRRLQGREMLESLLGAIAKERENIAAGQVGMPPSWSNWLLIFQMKNSTTLSRSSCAPAWTVSSPPIPPWGGMDCGQSNGKKPAG